MRIGVTSFVVLLLVSVLGSTMVYRHFQGEETEALSLQDKAKIELSEADKKLIDVRDSTSKWLLGLAFALLPGLIVKKTDAGESELEDKVLPMLAGALLITSLYGFFLAQDSVAFVLTKGPQYHLYGWVSKFPILLQFWSLLLALTLLMFHWFRLSGNVTFPKLLVVAAVLLPFPHAEAASLSAEVVLPCVKAWAGDRAVELDSDTVELAGNVVVALARRGDVSPPDVCEFVAAQLDQVRWIASTLPTVQVTTVPMALHGMESELKSTGISPGFLVERLLKFGEFWHSPSGLLRLEGTPTGATVMVNSRPVGLTNLDLRMAPGKYLIEVVADGGIIFKKADVIIEDGKLWTAKFGK